jgi:hypothetical protein
MGADDDLLLANPAHNVFVEVALRDAGKQTLDQFREHFLDNYRDDRPAGGKKNVADPAHFSDFHLREVRRLPPLHGAEVTEALFDVKHARQSLSYRIRFVKPRAGTTVYLLVAWTQRRRLEQVEPEVQAALDSFRLLADG